MLSLLPAAVFIWGRICIVPGFVATTRLPTSMALILPLLSRTRRFRSLGFGENVINKLDAFTGAWWRSRG